ncbi:MAG TPA: T9SS type A sorting domain-containing protein, partial [Bacteroidetes bacterium]|nr:T9SS type A sorting domain-containing protein [Bacteroidota bacterium]
ARQEPNPHPFIYTLDGTSFALQHNGTLYGSRWMETMRTAVLGEAFHQLDLFRNRPYLGVKNRTMAVDSEWLAAVVMKNVLIARNYGKDTPWALRRAVREVEAAAEKSGGALRFDSIDNLFTAGDTLYAVVATRFSRYNLWTAEFPGGTRMVLNYAPQGDPAWVPLREGEENVIARFAPGEGAAIHRFAPGGPLEPLPEKLVVSGPDLTGSDEVALAAGDEGGFAALWSEVGGARLIARWYDPLGLAEQPAVELITTGGTIHHLAIAPQRPGGLMSPGYVASWVRSTDSGPRAEQVTLTLDDGWLLPGEIEPAAGDPSDPGETPSGGEVHAVSPASGAWPERTMTLTIADIGAGRMAVRGSFDPPLDDSSAYYASPEPPGDPFREPIKPGTAAGRREELPLRTALRGVYPNPFNLSATVQVELAEEGRVRLTLFDITGRLAAHLADLHLPAGRHSLPLAAPRVASGPYLLVFEGPGGTAVRRVILLR